MQAKLVKQDAVTAFRIFNQLVVGNNFYAPVSGGKVKKVAFVIRIRW